MWVKLVFYDIIKTNSWYKRQRANLKTWLLHFQIKFQFWVQNKLTKWENYRDMVKSEHCEVWGFVMPLSSHEFQCIIREPILPWTSITTNTDLEPLTGLLGAYQTHTWIILQSVTWAKLGWTAGEKEWKGKMLQA